MKRKPAPFGPERASLGLGLGVGRRLDPHGGALGDHRGAALFDAVDQGLGVVAEAERRLEGVAFLQVAESEAALDLFGDTVDAVLNCDAFHFLLFV